MAAHVLALGPQAWQAAQTTWQHATAAAESAALYWAVAPQECKESIAFTLNVCGGIRPVRHTPGFGPLALARGWGLIGFLVGVLFCMHFEALLTRLEIMGQRLQMARRPPQAAAPPGLPPLPLWDGAVRERLVLVQDANQRLVLQRLAEDGEAALRLIAVATGASRRTVLAKVLGENFVERHANEWGLI